MTPQAPPLSQQPQPDRELHVETPDGALLRVLEYGEDDDPRLPTVVLAHGWTLSHRSWLPVLDRLRSQLDVRVVVYDQRGHGSSTPGPTSPSVRVLGDDLAAVVSAAAPKGTLVLGGHSMGGMSVLAYAGRHRRAFRARVRGTVLVSTAAGDLSVRRSAPEAFVMQALARMPRLPAGRAVSLFGQQHLLFGEGARAEDVAATREQVAATHLPTIGQFYAALGDHDEQEAAAQFRGIPTDIIVGAKDRLTPVHHSERLHELIEGSELTVLPRLGHMLTYEAPEVLTKALASHVHAAQSQSG
ncbi:Pimeloyl-ACP methyl ester carboxylesterase [Pedococcus cremeus]|uniref:Pimeloyl-ACP methyl ester carboxylesterase n=1 Tax=Pedococcus cremeus TaxID=587636 RepID=A0A1H9VUA3_9MICO|nr:alpha/beta hydrolase [Pedococcus cremeus]SES25336.1 Pimeloyl-ACP methyl ester carboxylesterase [Pedococcus cremeus]